MALGNTAENLAEALVDRENETGGKEIHNLIAKAKEYFGDDSVDNFLDGIKKWPIIGPMLSEIMETSTGERVALAEDVEGNSKELLGLKGETLWNNVVFQKKLTEVAASIRSTPEALKVIFQAESGIDPTAVNPTSKATGLIQFMPFTAKGLGTTVETIASMSAIKQLDLVEKYYKTNGHGALLDNPVDLYLSTFHPVSLGKPDNAKIGLEDGDPRISSVNPSASAIFRQNAPISKYASNDGYITVGDFKRYVAAKNSETA